MSTLLFHDFITSYVGHIDGMTVLDTEIFGATLLTNIDPPAGQMIVHARNMQKRDANGMRNQRVRVSVYGHGVSATGDVAEVLHSAIVGSGVVLPPNKLNPDQTFFDHVDSEQAPVMAESPGISSVCFYFDVVAVSRSIS